MVDEGQDNDVGSQWNRPARPLLLRLLALLRGKTSTESQESSGDGVTSQPKAPIIAYTDDGIAVRTLEGFPSGYPRLAAFADSHENFMLYRRFGYLSSRVLLNKQDELRVLEDRLEIMDVDDTYDFPDRLQKRELQGEERQQLLADIQAKFVEYAAVLSAAQQLMSFNKPTANEQRSAMNYMNNNAPIDPKETSYVNHKEDLVTLRSTSEGTWLDSLIRSILVWTHCGFVERVFCTKESKLKSASVFNIYYCQRRIAALTMGIVALMILFLLVVPTYWLSHIVSTQDGQLSGNANSLSIGVLLLFTLLFSIVISLFTSAKRHEIIASAAAYCAVLVVFLGNVGNTVTH